MYIPKNLNFNFNFHPNLNPNLNFNFNLILTLIPTLTPTAIALAEEQKWAIKIKKYGGRINLSKTIKNKLVEFIKIKIYIYKEKDFLNNTL